VPPSVPTSTSDEADGPPYRAEPVSIDVADRSRSAGGGGKKNPPLPRRVVVAAVVGVGRGVRVIDVVAAGADVTAAGGGEGGAGGGDTTGCCGWVVGVVARLGLVESTGARSSGSAVGSAGGGTTEVACGTGA
jgi:hypothetical protein